MQKSDTALRERLENLLRNNGRSSLIEVSKIRTILDETKEKEDE